MTVFLFYIVFIILSVRQSLQNIKTQQRRYGEADEDRRCSDAAIGESLSWSTCLTTIGWVVGAWWWLMWGTFLHLVVADSWCRTLANVWCSHQQSHENLLSSPAQALNCRGHPQLKMTASSLIELWSFFALLPCPTDRFTIFTKRWSSTPITVLIVYHYSKHGTPAKMIKWPQICLLLTRTRLG